MKIVIIGAIGRGGSNAAGKLSNLGNTVVRGAPATGINSPTGEV